MIFAFYDAESSVVGPMFECLHSSPADARAYALSVSAEQEFDHLDWLVVWNESDGPLAEPVEPYFSVFVLGDQHKAASVLTEPRLDDVRQQVKQAFNERKATGMDMQNI